MKKAVTLVIVVVMLLVCMTACQGPAAQESLAPGGEGGTEQASEPGSGGEEAAGNTGEGNVIKIAHCAPNQDGSQREFSDFIKANVDKINSENRGYTIEYTIFNAQLDQQTQIGQVEAAMVQGYDILIMFGVDSDGAAPVVKEAHDSGMIVVDICDMGHPEDVDLTVFGSNEELYADLRDEFLSDYLEKNPDVHLNTGVVYGGLNQLPQLPRGDRTVEFAEAHPDRMTILDTQPGEWYADKAMNIVEDWIQAYPELNYVSSANDEMTVGIVQALKGANKLDSTLVTSIDCTPDALDMIQKGEIACTIGVDQFDYASELIDCCIKLYQGEDLGEEYYVKKTWCVTQDNIEEYLQYQKDTRGSLA